MKKLRKRRGQLQKRHTKNIALNGVCDSNDEWWVADSFWLQKMRCDQYVDYCNHQGYYEYDDRDDAAADKPLGL